MEKVLFINGMGCPKCEARIRTALLGVEGVKKAYVSRIAKQAVVTAADGVTDEALVNAVKALESFSVEEILPGDLRNGSRGVCHPGAGYGGEGGSEAFLRRRT